MCLSGLYSISILMKIEFSSYSLMLILSAVVYRADWILICAITRQVLILPYITVMNMLSIVSMLLIPVLILYISEPVKPKIEDEKEKVQ